MKTSKLLFLGMLVVALAVPAMAAEVGIGKTAVKIAGDPVHPDDIYLIGQVIHYDEYVDNTNDGPITVQMTDIDPSGTTWYYIQGTDSFELAGPSSVVDLTAGERWEKDFHHVIQVGDLIDAGGGIFIVRNRVEAIGNLPPFDEIDAGATSTVRVVQPKICVTKEADTEISKAPDTINYTITIENCGDWTLVGITVDDSILGDLSDMFVDTLDPGESDTVIVPYVVTGAEDDPLINIVTAEGVAEGFDAAIEGATVSDEDSAEVDLVHPDFTVAKTCPPYSKPGDEALYNVKITNTGDTDLKILAIYDSLAEDVAGCVGQILTPDEFGICSTGYTYLVKKDDPDPLENTVVVLAGVVGLPNTLEREDSCETDLVHPDYTVKKICLQDPVEGDTAQFQITITNTSVDVPLTFVTDEAELLGPFTLPPGDSTTVVVERPVEDGDVYNEITVKATLPKEYGLDNEIIKSDNDTCTVQGEMACGFTQGYYGNEGGIQCDKTTKQNIQDALDAAGGSIVIGVLGENSITFDSPECIIALLPAGGPPKAIKGEFDCVSLPPTKKGRLRSVAWGQAVALTLNLLLDGCHPDASPLGSMVIPEDGILCTIAEGDDCPKTYTFPESLWGKSAAYVLAELNKALAGQTTTESLADLSAAADGFNNAYDECRTKVACPPAEICENGIDDDCDGEIDELDCEPPV